MHDDLTAFCESALPGTLEFLRKMVGINSFTSNREGIAANAELISEQFAALDFAPSSKQATNPEFGSHLALRRPPVDGPTIALLSHLDTVYPIEEEERNDFKWEVIGDRIYGPGTNDIKGGTAMIWMTLLGLQHAEPELFARTNWVILLNACEEVVSEDFGEFCREILPADTAACLIFEGDGGEAGQVSLVSSRKGRAAFSVDVEGKAAHAGTQHPTGANAIVQLAEFISDVSSLTDYGANLTVNVGHVSGGTVPNRVPHEASAVFEMRAFDPAVYQAAREKILAWNGRSTVVAKDSSSQCRVRVSIIHETVPWPHNPGTAQLLEVWKTATEDAGLAFFAEDRGGLSDGNVLWSYMPTLDGLGPQGENSHCSERNPAQGKDAEWVAPDSFLMKSAVNVTAISRLLQQ
ncbi:MAG TPA: M20/M25/M40 family metallo-hydrolase [Chthoniobacterales bacterium]|jgi:glutamate carboxypeptidase